MKATTFRRAPQGVGTLHLRVVSRILAMMTP